MLNEIQLESFLEGHGLPERCKQFVNKVRASDPSRSVSEGGFQNLSSTIYSEKMGHTIQSESATGETAAILEYEIDTDVLEYWDQIPPIKVKGLNKKGKLSSWTATPDFLVIRKDGVYVEEIKADTFIQKRLAEGHPAWKQDDNGNIHYLPLEEHFSELGIDYRVRPISTFNKKLLSNQKLLLASRREPTTTDKFARKVTKLLNKSFSMTMSELMEKLRIVDATPLIQLVDKSSIFCELEKEFLSDHQNVHLALTKQLSIHARSIREQSRVCLNMVGIFVDDLPPKKYAEDALQKLEAIDSGIQGRSIRRWRMLIKDGEAKGLSPFESLISRRFLSGNRTERLSLEVIEVFEKAVDAYYAKPTRPGVASAYKRYRKSAREAHPDQDPMCEATFRNRLKKLDSMKLGYKRGGKRMMNANSPTSDVEMRSLKAKVAFQRAHIDHHLVKCFIIWGTDGRIDFIGRPWLSLLIDEAHDQVLGYHFSFASPSRLADGCVLRDCVRRYGKLPEEVVADHGPDFKSVYFRSVLASEKVTLTHRPKSASKYGSEVERFFNEFMTQWLCQREGNMVNKHAVRAVDGDFSAKRHAVFRPEDLLWEFDQFIAHRNNKLRGFKAETVGSAFKASAQVYGCVGRKVEYNERFVIATAVETGEYTIGRNDIKIDGIRYSHPELRKTNGVKAKVEVRIEPENPYAVYACLNNRWISCAAAGAVEFMEKTATNQRVENLKIRGAGSLRFLAKNHADDALADLLEEADNRFESKRKVGWIDYEERAPKEIKEADINLFEQLSQVELQELPTTDWSEL